MSTSDHTDIFDLTPGELEERLAPAVAAAVQKRFAAGLPVTYRDEHCPTDSHFIHEYADGRRFLVLLDPATSTYTTIHALN